MNRIDAIKWIDNLITDIGQYQGLWHYEQALSEIKQILKESMDFDEVAELLKNIFGDECACNFNGIDEWLPQSCKYAESECPNPKDNGCWKQFLAQGGAAKEREREYEHID